MLREAALLADNTRLLRAATAPFEAQAAILRGFGAPLTQSLRSDRFSCSAPLI
jgi:hypothetical protein